jgi:large subunit ribosomal protein L23
MSIGNLTQVLLSPLMTEKSSELADKHRQFAFKVASTATKPQIKQAVEKLFKVTVNKVNTVTVRPKQKRFGRRMGTRSGWKKAYVMLAEGFDIEFANTKLLKEA